MYLSDIPVPDKPVCDIVDQENTFFCTIWPSWLTNKQNKMKCELMLTYDTPALRQTGSRNLTGQKTLPRYGVPIWSFWPNIRSLPSIVAEKNVMKNVHICSMYKNQLSRQTGSRNLTGPKTLPRIWHTYMKLVTKYQIPVINSCLKKCDEKYLGRTDGRTEVKQYTLLPLRGAGV
jgi:hypothetical protein